MEASDQKKSPNWLRALGHRELPPRVAISGQTYEWVRTFKHDFFAATGMYANGEDRIVVKIYRVAPLGWFPMDWTGSIQARHESRMYQLLAGIDGIPRFVGRVGSTGFAHAYVDGRPLARDDRPDDQFFSRLAQLLQALHARRAAYVDLEKRENIIVGTDGRPYLIDFQISWHIPIHRCGRSLVAGMATQFLQSADLYHLLKHKRRLRPDQLTADEFARSSRLPAYIRWHRAIFRPITEWRRRWLHRIGARKSISGRSEEGAA